MQDNPFESPDGLNFELVDSPGASPVHKAVKGVRVNGLDITRWIDRQGVKITAAGDEATLVWVPFLAASVRTVTEAPPENFVGEL